MTDRSSRDHLDRLYAKDPLQLLQIEHYHTGYFDSATLGLADAQQRHLEVLLHDDVFQPSHRVLDVGCGEGNTARWLVRRFGLTAVGVDIVASVLQRGRARDDLPLTQADMAQLPLRSGSIDAVIGIESVYHHANRAAVFAEFGRVLRPGGVLVLSENMLGRDPRRRATRIVSAVVESENLSPEDTYRDQLRAAGFVDISVVDVGELTAIGTANFLRSHAAERHRLFRAELGAVRGTLVSVAGFPLLHRLWCNAFRQERARHVFLSARRGAGGS